jgi:hypothetical protein
LVPEGHNAMICPGTHNDCDNPGYRHGGCQGRLPDLPLFRSVPAQPRATVLDHCRQPARLRSSASDAREHVA